MRQGAGEAGQGGLPAGRWVAWLGSMPGSTVCSVWAAPGGAGRAARRKAGRENLVKGLAPGWRDGE